MLTNPESYKNKIIEQDIIIQRLSTENGQLQDKVKYLEDKIKQLINEKIQERLKEKKIQLPNDGPSIVENIS